jgi:hypothetical protein
MTNTYYIELLGIPALIGVFVLLLAFPFALLAVAVLAVVVAAAVVVLVAGIVAAPFLLARAAWRHWTAPQEIDEPAGEFAYPARATIGRTA